jgi:uncharacterized protein YbjT (DUF2867 family)
MSNTKYKVLLAGATGLVGRELLSLLQHETRISEVRVLTRRLPQKPKVSSKFHILITDYSDLEENPDWFDVNCVFCALGTTMRKAGSKKAFREVDYEYPLRIAKLARAAGAKTFALVSAVGADTRSMFFYNRVKGEIEEAIAALQFPNFIIARPSLLLGDRRESRPAERFAKFLAPLAPPRYKPVHVRQVAHSLLETALMEPGKTVLENEQLRKALVG